MYKYKLEIKRSGCSIELKRTEKTIAILAKEIEDSKYRMGKTKANAYNTNMSTLERIKKHKFANIPIEKVTKKQIEDFLHEERVKSNSTIKKDYRMLKYVCFPGTVILLSLILYCAERVLPASLNLPVPSVQVIDSISHFM